MMKKRDLKADLEYCKKAHFDGRWLHTPVDFIDKAYRSLGRTGSSPSGAKQGVT